MSDLQRAFGNVLKSLVEGSSKGGAEPSGDSPWWRFKALGDAARSGPGEALVRLQEGWRYWEEQLMQESEALAAEALSLEAAGKGGEARRLRARLTAQAVKGTLNRLTYLGF